MLTLEQLRQIDPKLNDVSDEELIRVRKALYTLGEIIFDYWTIKKRGSKCPAGDSQVLWAKHKRSKI